MISVSLYVLGLITAYLSMKWSNEGRRRTKLAPLQILFVWGWPLFTLFCFIDASSTMVSRYVSQRLASGDSDG